MTDLETMRAMLTRAGAVFTENVNIPPHQFYQLPYDHIEMTWCGGDDPNRGYEWCHGFMLFSPDGVLLHVGATE